MQGRQAAKSDIQDTIVLISYQLVPVHVDPSLKTLFYETSFKEAMVWFILRDVESEELSESDFIKVNGIGEIK